MSMTPARLGASSTCALATPGTPSVVARTTQRIQRRHLMVRSLVARMTGQYTRPCVKNPAVLMSRRHRGGSPMRIGSYVIAVLLAATPVVAHHSNSAFDGDKVMVLTGTVTEWKWSNPHVWIFLSVDDGNGGKVQWEIEGRTPGQLVRAGWSRTTLKAGETITVDFSPAKDGTRTGLLTRVRRADGTVVGKQAPPAAQ